MIVPVLLSGGAGTRLWPVSRKSFPKQFIKFAGLDMSLFQNAVNRIKGLGIECSGIIVVANEEHRFLVEDQLASLDASVSKIILEPVSRNTAPAIALAAIEALKYSPQAKLLVQTGDHFIPDVEYFSDLIASAIKIDLPMMTFGVQPNRPATGFGYIECGEKIEGTQAFNVKKFTEKPDLETATKYIESGKHLWNSGMFLMNAEAYIDALSNLKPEICVTCKNAMADASEELNFLRVNRKTFELCPSISIDYAVMERSKEISVMPFKSDWLDVGAWDSVSDLAEADNSGNLIFGDGLALNTSSSVIHSGGRLVAALGVNDMLIVETEDAVLVSSKEAAQDVKNILDILRSSGRSEADEHVITHKPWGDYRILFSGESFKVKQLRVKPGMSLSLQSHKFRSEHWVVVQGTGEVINGDETFILECNQSTYIPAGLKHRLSNPKTADLIIIEVQTGSYFGEDDIVRYEDDFCRV